MALRVNPRLGAFANAMRREPTPFEDKLWQRLRASRLEGHTFRRQIVIEDRIVDFFCPSIGLAIEIDGDTHDADADKWRDAALGLHGCRVLRFTNADVATNIDGVLEAILMVAPSRHPRFTHPPTPSLEREGEI